MNQRYLPSTLLFTLVVLNLLVVVAQTLQPDSAVLETTAAMEIAAIGVWLGTVRGRRE